MIASFRNIRRSAKTIFFQSFRDQEKFERYVQRHCRKDLVVVVQKLRDLETNLPAQCHTGAQAAAAEGVATTTTGDCC